MANIRKILAGALIVGAGTIVVTYFQRQAKLLYNSCIKFRGVKQIKVSLQNFSMTLLLDYKNKSDISLMLVKQTYQIYVNGFLASTITSKEKTKIISHQTATLRLEVEFKPKDLLAAGLKNIEQILLDKEGIVIEVKGKMTVQTGIIFYSDLPFTEKMTLGELMHPSGATAEPC
jgi:LEA14-like dessication related protein